MSATKVICKVLSIVADENSKQYRNFASKLEGERIDVFDESDNIGELLGDMLRSLNEGRKQTYHHVLIISSENVNMLLQGLGLTKDNIEVLVKKKKVTLVLDDVHAQEIHINNILDIKVETILMDKDFGDLVDVILQSSYTA